MKIILSVESINHPLTGIGRYVWELAKGLKNKKYQHIINEIKFYRRGKWIENPDTLVPHSTSNQNYNDYLTQFTKLILKSKITRKVYNLVSPIIYSLTLNNKQGYLYHGPNFYLPKFSGKKIVTIHDLSIFLCPQFHPKVRVEFMQREIENSIKHSDFILTVSQHAKSEIINFFNYNEDKIMATALGVQDNFIEYNQTETQNFLYKYNLKYKQYILCLATIEPRKNISTLLHAYENLPLSIKKHYPLVIAGANGWNNENIYKEIYKEQNKGYLKYLSYIEENNLPLLLSAAKLFVFPSYYEGFGLPVLEAMKCGLPVICSNASSLPEVTRGNAVLIEPNDITGFSHAIENLIENHALCLEYSIKGKQIANEYTWDKTIQKTIYAYKKTLEL